MAPKGEGTRGEEPQGKLITKRVYAPRGVPEGCSINTRTSGNRHRSDPIASLLWEPYPRRPRPSNHPFLARTNGTHCVPPRTHWTYAAAARGLRLQSADRGRAATKAADGETRGRNVKGPTHDTGRYPTTSSQMGRMSLCNMHHAKSHGQSRRHADANMMRGEECA